MGPHTAGLHYQSDLQSHRRDLAMASTFESPAQAEVQYVALDANFADPHASVSVPPYTPSAALPSRDVSESLAKRVVIVNNIIYAIPGWISDIVAAYFFFSVAASYNSYSGYKPSGFPGTATFAGIIVVGQLIAVPFLLYFTYTADIWQWFVRVVFSKMASMCDCFGDDGCQWSSVIAVCYGFTHFIISFCVFLIAGTISMGGPPFKDAKGAAGYAPLIFGMMMFLRVMMGACYVWWYDRTSEYNVARHYGYLGSLAKIYYSEVSVDPSGSEIVVSDVQSISAGSSSTYIGNNTVLNTTFAYGKSYSSNDNSVGLNIALPVWPKTFIMIFVHLAPMAGIIAAAALAPFGGRNMGSPATL
eukprot:TRINITY_DN11956_c0_g1_i1.p1 TRINITY_DN11956_c0_g1~~TRINITY_DN11956_c0_g1_i1.p1  ORF type:complete len:359 (-),score=48.87 TRINITY_DN11956_c0_g1_i1:11-1087(-)